MVEYLLIIFYDFRYRYWWDEMESSGIAPQKCSKGRFHVTFM